MSHTFTQGGTGIRIVYDQEAFRFNEHAFYVEANQPASSGTNKVVMFASSIRYPDGEVISFTYDTHLQQGTFLAHRPTKITSSIGYELHIEY